MTRRDISYFFAIKSFSQLGFGLEEEEEEERKKKCTISI
jgi:hypothetical protein